jgi:hypothetical protein
LRVFLPAVIEIETFSGFANVVYGLVFEEKNLARNMKFVAAFCEAMTSDWAKKNRVFDAISENAGFSEANDVMADAVWDKFAARLKTNQKIC